MTNKPVTGIIYKSEIPNYIDAANKIYNKEYESAIDDLKSQLKVCPTTDLQNLAMIHINLMQAYFRSRSTNPEHFDLSTHHAKEAMKNGHNTGLAPFRLAVNLEKQNRLRQALEVCDVVTNERYHFSIFGYKQKDEFIERLTRLTLKLERSEDNYVKSFFSDEEVELIIKNSERNK